MANLATVPLHKIVSKKIEWNPRIGNSVQAEFTALLACAVFGKLAPAMALELASAQLLFEGHGELSPEERRRQIGRAHV